MNSIASKKHNKKQIELINNFQLQLLFQQRKMKKKKKKGINFIMVILHRKKYRLDKNLQKEAQKRAQKEVQKEVLKQAQKIVQSKVLSKAHLQKINNKKN